jgi:hypothetical protein
MVNGAATNTINLPNSIGLTNVTLFSQSPCTQDRCPISRGYVNP